MLDNNLPIDDFFCTQLSDFEAMPDIQLGDILIENHPVDDFFSAILNEDFSSENNVLPPFNNGKAIDVLLKSKLRDHLVLPDQLTFYNSFDMYFKKTMGLFLTVFLFALALHLISDNHTQKMSEKVMMSKSEKNENRNSISQERKSNIYEKKTNQDVQDKKLPKSNKIHLGLSESQKNRKIVLNKNSSSDFRNEDIEDLNLNQIGFKKYLFNYQTESELIESNKSKLEFKKPRLKRSPIHFALETGFIQDFSNASKLMSSNAHKDALNNFKQINQFNKRGVANAFVLGFDIHQNWLLRTGVLWSQSKRSFNFKYDYNQIPVYDSLDRLLGYLTLPPGASQLTNETVVIKQFSLSLPIHLHYKLKTSKNWSLWSGVGMEYVLSQTHQGELFDFNQEQLLAFKSVSRQSLLPSTSLLFKYQMSPTFALNFNALTTFSKNNVNIHQISYQYAQFNYQVRLGINYTPLIKTKK